MCQGETRHRRPHPFLYQSTIEIAEWSRPSTGRYGSAFEQIFQIVIKAEAGATAIHAMFASTHRLARCFGVARNICPFKVGQRIAAVEITLAVFHGALS